MYKLTVIAGPNRGSSFAIQEGESAAGRQTGNVIHLPSAKVSKRHCVFEVQGSTIAVRDEGSSNGTFVNGVLTRKKALQPGDRISIGDYVLELVPAPKRSAAQAPAVAGFGNVVQFPRVELQTASRPRGGGGGQGLGMAAGAMGAPAMDQALPDLQPIPNSLGGKVGWHFEKKVMPFFYGMLFKHEWRAVMAGLFAMFLVGNLAITVYPLLEQGRLSVSMEARKRARFMARQIAEHNAPILAAGARTKAAIGPALKAEGVQVAVLTDLDNRIIAPGERLNEPLTQGKPATIAVKAAKLFREGAMQGFDLQVSPNSVIAVEPVKIFNSQLAQNVVGGMAIVAVDPTLSLPGGGESGIVYAKVLVLTGLLGALVFFIMYRLTLKPFEVMNDDIDEVLKGNAQEVTHEFKIEELDPLWDVVNSAVQRLPRGAGGGGDPLMGGFGGGQPSVDDFLPAVRAMGDVARYGVLVCDGERRVQYMNAIFEEMTGIHADAANGQDIDSVARDQAFAALVADLLERAPTGGVGPSEDFDFSGISYRISASALGGGGSAVGYVLTAVKNEV